MIPKIIHSCWFGSSSKPELVDRCMVSWHRFMPNWQYMEWSDENFDIASAPTYVQQAYEAKKYAFVSDYVRLWALEKFGGLYMDVDFEVYKSFEDLLDNPAFAGFEGSKRKPVMMGVIASEPHNPWIQKMLQTYESRHFINKDGSFDMYPNTQYFTDMLEKDGFVCDGVEKDYKSYLHVYPVEYFCPILTTGEDVRLQSEDCRLHNYCEHKGLHSWSGNGGWKEKILAKVGPKWKTRIIKFKRLILG